ncbi:MAG: hypothetical protein PHR35_14540, partial [Kiritimatiellae bacterium]|nr:hypothetical protein [Kiritimatiellia bacterium]
MKIEIQEDGLVVRTPFYTVRLAKEGGRIVSLARKGGREFVYAPAGEHSYLRGGMAKEIECGFPGEMALGLFQEEILPREGPALRIRYTYHGKRGFFIAWAMTLAKTYTFREDSPSIRVEQTLSNAGEPEPFAMFRFHHEVRTSSDSVMVVPTRNGLLELPAAEPKAWFIRDFTEGLAGIWDRQDREALLFLPEYDGIAQFLIGAGKNSGTIEWYQRPFTIGQGASWTSSHDILPVRLESLDELPSVLSAAGAAVEPRRRDRRAQAPVAIRPGRLESDGACKSFERIAANCAAKMAAATAPVSEDNVRLPDGSVCSRAIRTQPGAGCEAILPAMDPIHVRAHAVWTANGPGQAEAFLGCCDPEGNVCATGKPVTLSMWDPEGSVELDVSAWAGKKSRLFLFGENVAWTAWTIESAAGVRSLFASKVTRTETEDVRTDASVLEDDKATRLYVSPAGSDSFTGTIGKTNAKKTDGPFATLERARLAVRELPKIGKQRRPIVVTVAGGTYELRKPLV